MLQCSKNTLINSYCRSLQQIPVWCSVSSPRKTQCDLIGQLWQAWGGSALHVSTSALLVLLQPRLCLDGGWWRRLCIFWHLNFTAVQTAHLKTVSEYRLPVSQYLYGNYFCFVFKKTRNYDFLQYETWSFVGPCIHRNLRTCSSSLYNNISILFFSWIFFGNDTQN